MSLGTHWVQAHGESFILLVGNKVDFGAEELSNQGAGIVEPFDHFAGKLREGCFSPISDEFLDARALLNYLGELSAWQPRCDEHRRGALALNKNSNARWCVTASSSHAIDAEPKRGVGR
jgi:hypothetical protein